MKAADFCAAEPEPAARLVAAKGYSYEYALQTMNEIPLCAMARIRSRRYGPVLFAAPARGRHDQIDPEQDHRQAGDWRFFNELKRELKALTMRTAFVSAMLAMLTVAALAAVHRAARRIAHDPGRASAAHDRAGAAFTLTSQDGAAMALADFRGKVLAVTFIFTACTDTCPLLTAEDGAGAGRAGAGFRQQDRLRLHHRRSGARHARGAEEYAQAFGANPAGWAFLTGTPGRSATWRAAMACSRARTAGRLRRPYAS